jgi:outer membrane lipoprotein-sorting protein
MLVSRRLALVALTACLASPALTRADPSPDDQALVARAVAYLDGLTAVKGAFQQTDQKGVSVTGTFYLARPGRARFQYDPPSGLLITSDGKTVVVTDSRLKTFQRVPLSSTPLALFLADHIRLDKGAQIERVDPSAGGYSITARDGHGLAQGQITLYFAEAPLRLSGWAIVDAQGRTTRVSLGALAPLADASPELFSQVQ